jgi:hypothetical protein
VIYANGNAIAAGFVRRKIVVSMIIGLGGIRALELHPVK